MGRFSESIVGMSAFIGRIDPNRGDALGLITFGSTAEVKVPLQSASTSVNAIGSSIASLEANGRTALLDALILAWNELKSWREHVRAIVVLTDGMENSSQTSVREVVRVFSSERRHSIVAFGLAYGSDADEELLRNLCELTGGSLLKGAITNVSEVFSIIAQKL